MSSRPQVFSKVAAEEHEKLFEQYPDDLVLYHVPVTAGEIRRRIAAAKTTEKPLADV